MHVSLFNLFFRGSYTQYLTSWAFAEEGVPHAWFAHNGSDSGASGERTDLPCRSNKGAKSRILDGTDPSCHGSLCNWHQAQNGTQPRTSLFHRQASGYSDQQLLQFLIAERFEKCTADQPAQTGVGREKTIMDDADEHLARGVRGRALKAHGQDRADVETAIQHQGDTTAGDIVHFRRPEDSGPHSTGWQDVS